MRKELRNKFSYHKPDEKSIQKVRTVRKEIRELADKLDQLCPEGDSKDKALDKLIETMMLANQSIVLDCPIDEKEL